MKLLALDSAVARCSATLVADNEVIAGYQQDMDRDQAAVLPVMTENCLRDAAIDATALDAIAVTVGPGSFTGIRSGLAFALGLGAGIGRPVVGVTVGEALADSLPLLGGRELWCVTHSRRGRIFLETADAVLSLAIADLPTPAHPVAIAGGASADIASRLAARGVSVMLTDARLPVGRSIAAVGLQRLLGQIAPRAAQPLYVDPPEARPAAGREP